MKTVNGYYVVRTESSEQKTGGIFVAMSNDTKFLKCKIVISPKDSIIEEKTEFLFTFKDKLREVTVDGDSLYLLHEDDIVAMQWIK